MKFEGVLKAWIENPPDWLRRAGNIVAQVVSVLLLTATLASCVIEVCAAELICQACAVAFAVKPAKFTVTGVLPCCLLITITVSAPSVPRTAANAERLSGFATAAETLVSPNVELLPS